MNRDMDLVRRILVKVGDDGPTDAQSLVTCWDSFDKAAWHIALMRDAGLIEATVFYADDKPYKAIARSLTWDGTEFLDNVRNDGVWRKVKDAIGETAGSVGFEVVKELAVRAALMAATQGMV